MGAKVLVANAKYSGKHVAMKSFEDNTIVASGKNPGKVYVAAQKKGVDNPVMVFVPKKDTTYIF